MQHDMKVCRHAGRQRHAYTQRGTGLNAKEIADAMQTQTQTQAQV